MKTRLTFAAVVVLQAVLASGAVPLKVELLDVKKIWNQAPHNAFTDLARWDDRFYCAFREGRGHVSTDGRIRVLCSKDADAWTSTGLIALDGYDLRDAHLSVTPDNRLMLLGGAAPRKKDGESAPTGSFVAFSKDGTEWIQPQIVVAPGRWLWCVTWHEGKAYGVSYPASKDPPDLNLLTSDDGLTYQPLVPKFYGVGFPNETTLRFDRAGVCYALVRRDKGGDQPSSAVLGISRGDYTQWQWHDLGPEFNGFGGPNLIQLPTGHWLAAGRMHQDGVHTALCYLDMTEHKMTRLLKLPSGGDTSYPGLVWHNDLLYLSYYSSHEGKTSIYLAKVRVIDKSAAAQSLPSPPAPPPAPKQAKNLSRLLDRLALNLRFPTAGRAEYRIERQGAVNCRYAFDGVKYALETASAEGSFSRSESYFDGTSSVQRLVNNDVAVVWEGARRQTPRLPLEQFCPTGVLADLREYPARLCRQEKLGDITCSVVEATLGDKNRLKAWVAAEPNVYPLRIERYEDNQLCYTYRAGDLRAWNGVLFPKWVKETFHRWDPRRGARTIESQDMIVASFEPNIHLDAQTFTPPAFPPPSASAEAAPVDLRTASRWLEVFCYGLIEVYPEETKDRIVLLCFFDLAQMQSRQCLRELQERERALHARRVTIMAVQAAKSRPEELQEWIVQQAPPFRIGRMEGDIEKAKSSWAVRSLPWMVLFNKGHYREVAGLTIDELDEGIAATRSRE